MYKPMTLILLLLLLLPVLPLPAVAALSGDLFAAETVVADDSVATRNTALSELLAEVMVRISGNAAISGQPAALELLSAAPSLVQQYRYRSVPRGDEMLRFLWARFDQPVIERMMRQRGLPVWVQRPRVLLWVATEQAGQRELLNLENRPAAREALLGQAAQRGMPLQLPLMDLEDQGRLTPADVWSDYREAIVAAAARYPHDVILSGRLRAQGGDRWAGNWSLWDGDSVQAIQIAAQPLQQALAAAVDRTQDLLAARYAPLPGNDAQGGLRVLFSAVDDLAGYGRLIALLDRLDPVIAYSLRHVEDDRFVFEFELRGSEQELVRALQLGGQLLAESAPLQALPVAGPPSTDPPADPETGPPSPYGNAAMQEPPADLYYRLLN